MGRTTEQQLLLGEWACLGILYPAPLHGFAIAARLKPGGDIGRVWSLSRALTYRSLDQLAIRGYLSPVGEEPGIAGGNRTILAATRTGRAQLRRWLATPVVHLRDLRSELLLKLIVAEHCAIDIDGDARAATGAHRADGRGARRADRRRPDRRGGAVARRVVAGRVAVPRSVAAAAAPELRPAGSASRPVRRAQLASSVASARPTAGSARCRNSIDFGTL